MPKRSNNGLYIALAIGGGVMVMLVGACVVGVLVWRGAKIQDEGGFGDNGPIEDVPYIAMITNDFTDNAINAEKKWIGKRVRIKVLVLRIDRNDRGVFLDTFNAAIYPNKSDLDAFAKIRTGDNVIIEMTVARYQLKAAGVSAVVYFDNARVIENKGRDAQEK